MPGRKPDPLDAMVGAKIRVIRVSRGLSQSDLADQIGITFQQVQKYEKGANRVGASRLSQIATVLGISVGELFEQSRQRPGDSDSPFKLLVEPGAVRVLKAYVQTTDPRLRRAIVNLIEGIASRSASRRGARLGEERRRTSLARN
ncbi:helix-turn-helix transcriptional regulator [Bradyrhizobium sp. Tv2a-2]|uniref:helix-turn-helix domain-containing protein n=1 Tax=Bradyrhizobium sp. Tv2a-2 TaxID=113395 RepID=UPI00041A7C16|nr:helix-turn-helix transcriptional regulator [Bradyrhizobium sp. Tv2a-2]